MEYQNEYNNFSTYSSTNSYDNFNNNGMQGNYNFGNNPSIPPEYKPISPWGYVGWNILFAFPFFGWIIVLVLAFASQNINLKNYARSFLCVWLIVLILLGLIITFAIVLVSNGSVGQYFEKICEFV